jgi:enterochelin esterase-like enzyme
VTDTRRRTLAAEPVPATLTCGAIEENLANNREMAGALHAQGYRARLVELPDVHNYVAWRDAFDPYLTELLAEVWAG